MNLRILGATGAAMLAVSLLSAPAEAAARCRNTGSFESWLAAFKQEAAAQGISRQAISAALDGVTFDPAIIRRDSGQGVFQQSFLQFAGRMTAAGRYQNGLKQLKANAALLVPHRAADRRAAARGGRAVGPRERLRRLQGRHLQYHPLGRDLGLRLPALGVLPRPADGRGPHRGARRSQARAK